MEVFLFCKATLFEFDDDYNNILGVLKLETFMVDVPKAFFTSGLRQQYTFL